MWGCIWSRIAARGNFADPLKIPGFGPDCHKTGPFQASGTFPDNGGRLFCGIQFNQRINNTIS